MNTIYTNSYENELTSAYVYVLKVMLWKEDWHIKSKMSMRVKI